LILSSPSCHRERNEGGWKAEAQSRQPVAAGAAACSYFDDLHSVDASVVRIANRYNLSAGDINAAIFVAPQPYSTFIYHRRQRAVACLPSGHNEHSLFFQKLDGGDEMRLIFASAIMT
jgi:hypothetical protein